METSTDYKMTGEKARVFAAFADLGRRGGKDLHYHLGIAAMYDELDRLNGALARKEKCLQLLEDGDWCDELKDLADLHGLTHREPLKALLEREIEEDGAAAWNLDSQQASYIDE